MHKIDENQLLSPEQVEYSRPKENLKMLFPILCKQFLLDTVISLIYRYLHLTYTNRKSRFRAGNKKVSSNQNKVRETNLKITNNLPSLNQNSS